MIDVNISQDNKNDNRVGNNSIYKTLSKKKLLLFAPDIFIGGGTERVLVNLANELVEKWEVVIAVNDIGKKELYPLHESIKVKKYRYGNLRKHHQKNIALKVINKLFGTLIIQQFLRKKIFESVKLIISFSPSITNECYATKFRTNLISFEHWPFSAYNKYPRSQKLIRTKFPHIKSVVVLTEHEKKVYEEIGCKVVLIPNAYSFFPEETSSLVNKVVLSVGHFNNQKRRDLLVRAWKEVNNVKPDWQLWIVGEGPQRAEIERLIQNLDLHSVIKIIEPTDKIKEIYKESSIFVLSSEFEALPLVLLEAKASGLPCVSFDIVSGPNEIIQNGKDGFLVDFPNIIGFAKKISILIEDVELRKKFGIAARDDAFKRYNPQQVYAKWHAFLEDEVSLSA